MSEQPKRKRVLLQPTKEVLREQLALAADEIIRVKRESALWSSLTDTNASIARQALDIALDWHKARTAADATRVKCTTYEFLAYLNAPWWVRAWARVRGWLRC